MKNEKNKLNYKSALIHTKNESLYSIIAPQADIQFKKTVFSMKLYAVKQNS